MDIFTHRRKKADWKKIGKIGGFMRKEDNHVGAAVFWHTFDEQACIPHICPFFTPLHCDSGNKERNSGQKELWKKLKLQ